MTLPAHFRRAVTFDEGSLELSPVSRHLGRQIHVPDQGVTREAACSEFGHPFVVALFAEVHGVAPDSKDEAVAIGGCSASENYIVGW